MLYQYLPNTGSILELTAAKVLAFHWIAVSIQVNLLQSAAPLLGLARSIYVIIFYVHTCMLYQYLPFKVSSSKSS